MHEIIEEFHKVIKLSLLQEPEAKAYANSGQHKLGAPPAAT